MIIAQILFHKIKNGQISLMNLVFKQIFSNFIKIHKYF